MSEPNTTDGGLASLFSESLPPGTRVEDYILGEELGTGGFAVVQQATDVRDGTEVAIKIIPPSSSARFDNMTERFMREIDVVRRLEHPNVVRLHDYGALPSGHLWMAMELIQGADLAQTLKVDGPFSSQRAIAITRQILDGLREAHESQIVHRDIKPGNIMLTELDGESEVVKILDFGMGKAFGEGESGHDITVEQSGVAGTPRYLAPELLGDAPLAPTSDVYAVGLILIEMIAGEPAIKGANAAQILTAQVMGKVDVPAFVDGSVLGPIIRKATAKEPENRYQTAGELMAAIDLLDSTDVAAIRNGTVTRPELAQASTPKPIPNDQPLAVAPPSSSPGRLVVAALLVLGVIGAVVWALAGSSTETPTPATASDAAAPEPPRNPPETAPAEKIAEPAPTVLVSTSDIVDYLRTAPLDGGRTGLVAGRTAATVSLAAAKSEPKSSKRRGDRKKKRDRERKDKDDEKKSPFGKVQPR